MTWNPHVVARLLLEFVASCVVSVARLGNLLDLLSGNRGDKRLNRILHIRPHLTLLPAADCAGALGIGAFAAGKFWIHSMFGL